MPSTVELVSDVHNTATETDTTVPAITVTPTFAELGVRAEIVRALHENGIDHTFAIQELTLPLALAGDDLIGQARTGMGKTFGFGVPLLHRIVTGDTGTRELDGTPRALIIVPTRELCLQVTKDLEDASKYLRPVTADGGTRKLSLLSVYGGRPYETQTTVLAKGVDVVVGTPGRLLDLAKQGHLILGKVGVLVLDEADEMLDLGFLPDIERILRMVPDKRQTMLFSATMPGPIITLARTFLTQPTHIRAEEAHSSAVHDRTVQHVFRAHAMDKVEVVSRILQASGRGATMIFARTKRTAQKVADELAERGFAVGAVHGDLGQIAREKALKAFRGGKIDVLVATDVAARGIDIDDVTHVINYQCPEDEKTYVHRIGRTGRAGRTGIAVTLVDWDDIPRWGLIDKGLNLQIAEPVETYSSSPHLYEELNIPAGITGSPAKAPAVRVAAVPTATETSGTGNAEQPASDDQTASDRPRRVRNRRRTRSSAAGNGVAGSASVANEASANVARALGSDTESSSTPTGGAATDGTPRKRRRRRRSSGSSTGSGADTSTVTAAGE